jgi:hypothetical protein
VLTRLRALLRSWLYQFALDNPPSDGHAHFPAALAPSACRCATDSLIASRRATGARASRPFAAHPALTHHGRCIPRRQRFLSELLAVREDFGDRILTQRLTVYRRWVKSFSPEGFDNMIRDQNRDLLVARLSATVNMSLEVGDRECIVEGKPAPCPPEEGKNNTL